MGSERCLLSKNYTRNCNYVNTLHTHYFPLIESRHCFLLFCPFHRLIFAILTIQSPIMFWPNLHTKFNTFFGSIPILFGTDLSAINCEKVSNFANDHLIPSVAFGYISNPFSELLIKWCLSIFKVNENLFILYNFAISHRPSEIQTLCA